MDDETGDSTSGGRWVTYNEIATVRAVTRGGAIRLVQRHKWRRQPGNDALTPTMPRRAAPTVTPVVAPDGAANVAMFNAADTPIAQVSTVTRWPNSVTASLIRATFPLHAPATAARRSRRRPPLRWPGTRAATTLPAATFAGIRVVVTDKGDVKTLESQAQAMARWIRQFPTQFPMGSGEGHNTKALPAIWSDPAGFQKAAGDLADAATKLAELAKAGDAEAVVAQVQVVGDACGACHRRYRAR